MPNWVFNGLTIEGNPDEVNKLVEQMNQPFSVIHDSWDSNVMSMRKIATSYSAPIFAFWNIIKPTDLEAYHSQRDHTKNISDAMKFEGNDWYDFNVREWGTKWDVGVSNDEEHPDTYMEGPIANGENLVVYYNFNTAWSRPLPALEKLSAQYPTLLFTLSYEEETGWGGECEFLRGEYIAGLEYNTQCNECDAYDTLEYCEECEYDCCDTCGWNGDDVDTHKAHMVEFALTNKENA
jgi:hypothetical protein